ncbi:MAG: DUF3102 domain-containing protein [Liquorilactobacillus ghanensis]|uniref:DUF3102 domain-containing protein n=1 Tax=Liquorilactobacillus ghanensis TaxID=399370 RepID=UPI0039ECE697
MNEVALSNDLIQLTTEIKTYQSIGGQAIFEIGRRLKWVKEHDLAHGEFGKWLKSIEIQPRQAQRFIKIATEFSNTTTSSHLGMNVLYEIATMPAEERDKPQKLSSGEVKKPDEMTVRELREVKRKLKEKEQALQDKDSQISKQAEMIDRLNEREPKVVEKTVTVEKTPDDYYKLKGMVENTKSLNQHYEEENAELRKELASLDDKSELENADLAEEKKHLEAEILSLKSMKNIQSKINNFVEEVGGIKYSECFNCLSPDSQLTDSFERSISGLEKWISDIKQELKKSKLIEGEILNGKS